ncbi:DNA-binding LacI/PurR family transcriptional regulator [Puniceicoccus vermicola]
MHSLNIALRELESEGLVTIRHGSGVFVNSQKGTRYIEFHRDLYPKVSIDTKEASLAKALGKAGWSTIVQNYHSGNSSLDITPNKEAHAHVVLSSLVASTPRWLNSILESGKPTVLYGREGSPYQLEYVTGDEHHYLSLLIKHLKALKHRNIAFLVNEPASINMHNRCDIFQTMLDMLELEPGIIIPCDTEYGESSTVKAKEGLEKHLQKTKGKVDFTALICASSAGVVGAMRALHNHGLSIPKDCSLASFGRHEQNSLLVPSVTEAGAQDDAWGEAVVEVLKNRFKNPDSPLKGIKLKAELFPKESTGTPPQKVDSSKA